MVSCALFLVVLGAGIPAAAGALHGTSPASGAEQHVVQPGDTVWSIASGVAGGRDPREVVAAIEDANGIDVGVIVPGQSLVIPAA